MRKQTKKVLSWVLAGAMTLGLTANVNFAPASADDATAFTAKLSAQMDVTKSDVAEWDFSAEGTGKLGELSTVTYDSDKKACFSGNFIGIDTDLTYVEGQTAKIYSIKADGKELENVDLSLLFTVLKTTKRQPVALQFVMLGVMSLVFLLTTIPMKLLTNWKSHMQLVMLHILYQMQLLQTHQPQHQPQHRLQHQLQHQPLILISMVKH